MLQYNIDLSGKTILLTGVAGFIGSNLAKRLLADYQDIRIIGIDSITDYYDVRLKEERLRELGIQDLQKPSESADSRFRFIRGDIADRIMVDLLFDAYHPQVVVNLAAQAGVRYSITNPDNFIQSNLIGFFNILGLPPPRRATS